jgi:hypothetical protein
MNRAQGSSLVALLVLAVALSGCGSGGGSSSVATEAAPASHQQATTAKGPDVALSSAATKAARAAGRKACSALTPLQAAGRFELPARKAGASKDFASYIAHPPPSTLNSPGFPRLVAALYATTLPAKQRADAAAGCAEELASPSSGRQDSP